jgi:hypothetical protein
MFLFRFRGSNDEVFSSHLVNGFWNPIDWFFCGGTHAYPDADPHCDGNSHTDADSYSHCDTHPHAGADAGV